MAITSTIDAVMEIEVEPTTEEAQLAAWAFLIRTGACWNLQGWYGRTARSLIESGIISPAGDMLDAREDG